MADRLVTAVLLLLSLPGWGDAPPARLDLGEWSSRPFTDAERAGQVHRERLARFSLGPTTYGIRAYGITKPDDPAFYAVGEGSVGMPQPASEGWYHGGFLFLQVDGQDVTASPLASFEAAEAAPRAVADLVWRHPLGDFRCRFLGVGGDDYLRLRIDLEPKATPQTVRLVLRAYPSYFTSWNKRVGARRVKLPGGLVAEGERKTFPAAEAGWAVLYDEVFDVARGEGNGPCGVALAPGGVRQVEVIPSGYPVELRVDCEPTARTLELAFWDWRGQTNEAVLGRFPAAGEAAARELAATDWRPGRLATFDPAAVRAELERAVFAKSVTGKLRDQVADLLAWLGRCGPLFQGDATEGRIAAEESFLAGYADYERLVWDVRLAELLDF